MSNSIENNLSDAQECVTELRESIDKVVNAMNELEGSIDDSECLEGLDVMWTTGTPDISDMLHQLTMVSASFSHTEDL